MSYDLYIASTKADTDSATLLLMNYAREDLNNPAIVKNSYSQALTLKGSATNNAIFGAIYRLDKQVGYNGGTIGADFDPSKRTPFEIRNDRNEILESGYLKLNKIERTSSGCAYNITLYGGLGGFLYSLAYDEQGNKRTLADLQYLDGNNPETELDFRINKETIQAAWADTWNEYEDEKPRLKWEVINFAPAYNGIPENFSADKAIVTPSAVGLSDTYIDSSGKTFTPKNGASLVSLPTEVNEWEAKDLRSYLQRPVLSMWAFLRALERPNNVGGYSVDLSDILHTQPDIQEWEHLWLTLPLLPSIGLQSKQGALDLLTLSKITSASDVGEIDIDGAQNLPQGTTITARFSLNLFAHLSNTATTLYNKGDEAQGFARSVIFAQAVAEDASGNIVGASEIQTYFEELGDYTPASLAEYIGFVPKVEAAFTERQSIGNWAKSGAVYKAANTMNFNISARNARVIRIYINSYLVTGRREVRREGRGTKVYYYLYSATTNGSAASLFPSLSDAHTSIRANNMSLTNTADYTITYKSAGTRSGALITKQMLLSTSETPADYLLSYCKMFGFVFDYDPSEKRVRIVRREHFYTDSVKDLSRRIDYAQGVEINPLSFSAKWLNMEQESVGGAFGAQYEKLYGVPYGIARVNTGYDYDASEEDILTGNVFKSAVTILDKSQFFINIKHNNRYIPAVFNQADVKYTLYNGDESTDLPANVTINSRDITYMNDYIPYYDLDTARKMEFKDASNKPIDGAGVLLFWEGWARYENFALTDDTPEMDSLNNGEPCWLLGVGQDRLSVPLFQRYTYAEAQAASIDNALDFGRVKEFNIRHANYADTRVTIYERRWQDYMRDRLSINTRVLLCRVLLNGLGRPRELFKSFYFIEGALWVLNKISNYDLTTDAPVECEFIQVQDKKNYIAEDAPLEERDYNNDFSIDFN